MRPHAGGPARVWTDDTLARVREALGRHRTIAGAAAELGMSASGIQSAFWSRREQLGGQARDFLMRSSAPVSASAIPVVQGSAPQVTPQVAPQVTPQVERPYAGAATVAEPDSPIARALSPAPSVHNCTVRRRSFSVERILVLPDTHRPFHSEQAWEVAMRAGKAFKPDRIIHLGDLWDFYAISFHPKSPDRKSNLEAEINSGCEALDEMATLGASRLDITLGNHCHRWDRYLTQNAPDMFNFLRFPDVVRFKERGWNVTPYREHLTVGRMHFTHEVGFCGKLAHRQSRQEFEGNVVIGHTHALAAEYKGTILNSSHVGIMLGWLGDKTAIDYAHRARAASWQHGFGLAYHEPNGNVHVLPTPIIDGRCVVEGQIVEAPAYRRQAA